jgi:hypothetical protein
MDRSLQRKRGSLDKRHSVQIIREENIGGALVSVDQWSQFLSKELEIEIQKERLAVQVTAGF